MKNGMGISLLGKEASSEETEAKHGEANDDYFVVKKVFGVKPFTGDDFVVKKDADCHYEANGRHEFMNLHHPTSPCLRLYGVNTDLYYFATTTP